MRFAWILLLVPLGACRSRHHVDCQAPIQGFLREVESGTTMIQPYRAYFANEVRDVEIREWSESLAKVVKALGRDVECEVTAVGDSEARVRVQFLGAEEASFVVGVLERWSGWWIASVDLASLKTTLDSIKPDGYKPSWWRRE